MKIFFIKASIILLFSVIVSINPNGFFIQSGINEMDSYMIEKFEGRLLELSKAKFFNLKKEKSPFDGFLPTKEKAIAYSISILKMKFPNEDAQKLIYYIAEDKSKKMWFIYVRAYQSSIGNGLSLIIVKDNCKIVSYEKTR